MTRIFSLVSMFISPLLGFSQTGIREKSPADWVDPLIGTQSSYSLSSGNTYPAIAMPWGMNFWTPQTGKMGDGWQYTYTSDKIKGFKQTHQPSPWMNDYGVFSLMPVTGKMRFRENDRASWFSHKAEVVKPFYYSVYLADMDVTTEITTSERAASFVFTFPDSDSSFVVIDAFDNGSYVKILPADNKIIGYSTKNSGGVPDNFRNYFTIHFEKPFTVFHAWHDSVLVNAGAEMQADHAGAIIGFKTKKGERINVKVASSFISPEQAEINLRNEIGDDPFETTKAKSKAAWNKVLRVVKPEGGSDAQMTIFYSCLYRAVCFPQKMYEIDADKKIIHYSPYNGKVLPGYMYAGTGFWDTFRALYPLLNLLYPSVNIEMQKGLVNDYLEGGFLPEWSAPGFRNVMIGNNSASVVADAYLKGLRGYDINKLYEALVHGANHEGPLDAVGRKGVKFYNALGYVPYDTGINENVARTLEYAYDDFAIYQLAKKLNRSAEDIALYKKRMLNYRNVFDTTTKLMRGRNTDGSFATPFNPFKWGDAFTEGNSWHYSWSVFHDIAGLKKLMGGNKYFTKMLDSVFSLPPIFDDSYYGFPIHEIREMQIMDMGQYAHGNQPIQHMIYLYNYAGEPWKTQYWIRQVMNKLYSAMPDGYCGDEDNGQTSAWYIFSAMGFYPVCPATEQYVLGAPLFEKITLTLENGKTVTINAPANSDENIYVKNVGWNNDTHSKNYISHFDLLKGGVLEFSMDSIPNKMRGTQEAAYPYSFSTHE